MDSPCDVPECSRETYLGWRPDTEPIGRKVCENHWRRHRDEQDSFDLFEAFGFRRPVGLSKPVAKKDVGLCGCGRELEPNRRLCTECAAERERRRKKRYYHDKKNRPAERPVQEVALQCKQCGNTRLPGHSYCEKCADRRKKQSNRERRRRFYRRAKSVPV